jgi:aldose 1-epimerase
MAVAPSGQQIEIQAGEQRATIVEVGGGIREYEVAGRPVLDPYQVDQMADGAHGMPLIPWPNRLADGRYSFDGEDFQVALTEPSKHNAIHGFLRWRPWLVAERDSNRVLMTARLYPLEGYPFALDLSIAYELGDEGLTATTTAKNIGDRACPYGHGQHPYLSPGDGLVDGCTLELRAATRIVTDEERQLPVGREEVSGSPFDFSEPRSLDGVRIDYAFTDLERDESGRSWARLRGADGRSAETWVDESFPYLEIYTGDTLSLARARHGLGTEPMTCAPNGFASGEGLVRLEPGDPHTTRWGARLS